MNLGSFQKRIKTALLLVLVVIVLVATVFFGQRVSVYFARAGQCPVKNVTAKNVSANSAVVSWDTDDKSQGRVEYGTNAVSLSFTAPEAVSDKVHNVPLTLLTPNTIYYYLVAVGDTRCDASGAKCEGACTPYSFTTSAVTPQEGVVEDIPIATSAAQATPAAQLTPVLSPTSSLSQFCQQVQVNIGKSNRDTSGWAQVKNFDVDGNGIINGLDIIKCQKSGK